MSIRIRYKKTKTPNVLTSTRNFVSASSGGVYRVDLHLDTMTYRVLNVNKQIVIKSSQLDNAIPCTHIATLRRQAKKAIKSLGVEFDVEIRDIDKKEGSNEQQTEV